MGIQRKRGDRAEHAETEKEEPKDFLAFIGGGGKNG